MRKFFTALYVMLALVLCGLAISRPASAANASVRPASSCSTATVHFTSSPHIIDYREYVGSPTQTYPSNCDGSIHIGNYVVSNNTSNPIYLWIGTSSSGEFYTQASPCPGAPGFVLLAEAGRMHPGDHYILERDLSNGSCSTRGDGDAPYTSQIADES